MAYDRAMFRAVRPLLILSLIAIGSLAFTAVAGAHSDAGEMEILKLKAKGNNRVLIEVGVVYGNDGHIAENAEVTARLDGPGGPYVASLEQVGDGSRFRGTVNVKGPGKYKVTVTSISPDAEATSEVRVKETAEPAVTEAEAEVETTDTTPTEADETLTATEEVVPVTENADDSEGDNSDDGGIPGVWIAVIGFLAVIGGVIGFWISQRRRGGGNHA